MPISKEIIQAEVAAHLTPYVQTELIADQWRQFNADPNSRIQETVNTIQQLTQRPPTSRFRLHEVPPASSYYRPSYLPKR
jgi:hypothetical protein